MTHSGFVMDSLKWGMVIGESRMNRDRRRSCRYPVVFRHAVLSWADLENKRQFPVTIENLSLQGCLLNARKRPGVKSGQKVFLRVGVLGKAEQIEGVLLSAVKKFLGRCVMRIRFVEPLQFQTFKQLIYGPRVDGQDANHRPDHEREGFWK